MTAVLRFVAGGVAGAILTSLAFAATTLDIYFIDVEGGASTLLVTPSRESLLIDAGYSREGRDPDRIVAAARAAGIDRIDYLVVTHFHPDHVGGVPELAARLPIGSFVDYGEPLGTPFGNDRMSGRSFSAYDTVRSQAGQRLIARPGDRLPLPDVEAIVVNAGGDVLSSPLPGAGAPNAGCGMVEDQPADGTENYRSVGLRIRFGEFRFLDLGDLSGNTLASIACPRDLLGPVSVYLVAHHGDYDTNIPALYASIRPRVAVMNNGPSKGGSPDALRTLHALHLEGFWQLHASSNARAINTQTAFIANTNESGDGHWIKLSASSDGSFRIVNGGSGVERAYPPGRPER